MNVLVLGGRGFVGNEIINQLKNIESITPVIGARSANNHSSDDPVTTLKVDSTNFQELLDGLENIDVVINCVTGDGHTISEGARLLCKAAKKSGLPKIIHLSSQSVYGTQTGNLTEETTVQDDLGWYGHAKIIAEQSMIQYAQHGGEVVILRPGCISGKSSPLWALRVTTWLQQRRLGDLGICGDGWSNLIDVTDVAQAAIKSIFVKTPSKEANIYNLSAPDSPRWNQYFIDLSILVNATPVQRINHCLLKIKTYFLGVPIKIIEHIFKKTHLKVNWLPQEIPPSLLKLFSQNIKLNSEKATTKLSMTWTPYLVMIKNQINKDLNTKDFLQK